jgi:CDP-diacylglycerol--glycerol-3-phosphate 3-phosphatidyltransferase
MTVATFLTLIRLGLAPLFVIVVLRRTPLALWTASAIFTVAAVTDFVDGYLARRTATVTRAGRILDPIADKLLVAVTYLSFLFLGVPTVQSWMVAAILGREAFVTWLRSYVGRRGLVIHSSPLGKWKTGFQLGFVFALLAVMSVRAASNPAPAHWTRTGSPFLDGVLLAGILATTMLTVVSGFDYFWKTRAAIAAQARSAP